MSLGFLQGRPLISKRPISLSMANHCTSDAEHTRKDRDELERLRRWCGTVPTDPDARLLFARKLLDCRRTDEAIMEIRAVISMVSQSSGGAEAA